MGRCFICSIWCFFVLCGSYYPLKERLHGVWDLGISPCSSAALLFLGVPHQSQIFLLPPHDGTGIGPFDWRVVFRHSWIGINFALASAACQFNSSYGCDGIVSTFANQSYKVIQGIVLSIILSVVVTAYFRHSV